MAESWGNQVWVNSNYFQTVIRVDQGTVENTRVYFSAYGLVYTRYRYNVYANGSVWDNDGGSKSYNGRLQQNAGVTTTFASYGKWITRTKSARTITFSASYTVTGGYGNGTSSASTTVTVPALPSYAVSYNANGGTGAPGQQTKWYNEALTLSSTKPTRTGYTFQGWATSSGGSVAYAAGASYTSNAGVTLYAVWKANTWTVTYNANGGTGAPSSQTKTYGVTLKLSSTKPTRTNYDFLGWGTSASATTVAYAAGANYTSNAAITLYAVWKLAYSPPSITGLVAQRCDSAGTADDFGEYFKVSFGWSCDQKIGTNNVSSIQVKYKARDISTWTTTTISASGTSGTASKIIGGISIEDLYDVQIIVTDSRDSTTVTSVIPSAKFVMDFLAGGNGVAFGKPADEESLDINMLTRFRQPKYYNSQSGNGTTIGFIKVCTLTAINVYNDSSFALVVANRGAMVTTLYFRFVNVNSTTLTVSSAFYIGSIPCYIVCNGNKAEIWCRMTGSWDVISLADFIAPASYVRSNFIVDYATEMAASLPSGTRTAAAQWLAPQTTTNSRPLIGTHIGLANGIYLQGKLTSGSFANILRMNASNQVELNWTTGGLRGRVMKLLWEGTWTSGSITVPEHAYYNVFVIVLKTNEPLVGARVVPGSPTSPIYASLNSVGGSYMWCNMVGINCNSSTTFAGFWSGSFKIGGGVSMFDGTGTVAKIYGLL